MSRYEVVGRAQHFLAIQQDLSLRQVFQAVNTFEQRGFPAPAFAYNTEDLAPVQPERNIPYSFKILLVAVIKRYVVYRENGYLTKVTVLFNLYDLPSKPVASTITKYSPAAQAKPLVV